MIKSTVLKDMNFEDALARLESIIEELEDEESNLDSAVKLFEEAMLLKDFCSIKLNETEKKIQILVDKKDGEKELKDFDFDN